MKNYRQALLTGNLRSRGTIQENVGVNSQNKIIKTNSAGYIDLSIIHPSINWDDRSIGIALNNISFVNGTTSTLIGTCFISEDNHKVMKLLGLGVTQAIDAFSQIIVDSDNVNIDSIKITAKTDVDDVYNAIDITIYKNAVSLATDTFDLTTAYTENTTVIDTEFAEGDVLNIFLNFTVNNAEAVFLKKVIIETDAIDT